MASLATHALGAASASVENVARSDECEHNSDTQATAPVVHKEKDVSIRVKEHSVRDALPERLRGRIEIMTPSGATDVLTKNVLKMM